MLKVVFSRSFHKTYPELLKDQPEIKTLVGKLVDIFKHNPEDTRLRNHKLSGKMAGQFAFSITNDIRIIYEVIGKNTVRFLAIGSHEKIYS